ncbi:hypothetical protein AQUCO_05800019v1 [Aquilegia coerulea]|uniref:Glycosyltransferase n=1 Tax=Aquilegia coerulea TaxID=218851 RepID=A0A2G5CE93_AQUCA|nr:hypothetical protein AQUCO_05800019v1 [Aquilegia coerulea]
MKMNGNVKKCSSSCFSCNCKSSSPPPPHVLVVTYPTQGHINPLLQFSKRLVSKGDLKVTLAITLFVANSMKLPSTTNHSNIQIKTFSDGFDQMGSEQADTVEAYLNRFKIVGSQTLRDLITKQQQQQQQLICYCSSTSTASSPPPPPPPPLRNGEFMAPFCCVIYDPFLPWALDVAKEFSLLGAPFFTQSCAVNSIYFHVQQGLLSVPLATTAAGTVISLPGLPPMEVSDLPSFISDYESYPSVRYLVLNQFSNINKADWIFVNIFHMLEHEVVNWMSKLLPIRTIGPTVPSVYLDNRVEGDNDYGLNLFEPSRNTCIDWLNTKEIKSVVYVSFGSLAVLKAEQMEQLAWALIGCNYNFLWVVRALELNKLPTNFSQQSSEKGLVVTWCPQLEVLCHQALGCFTDIETCIREVMEGEKGEEIMRSANTWKILAKEAVDKGGSSDSNIEEFVNTLQHSHAEKVDASDSA